MGDSARGSGSEGRPGADVDGWGALEEQLPQRAVDAESTPVVGMVATSRVSIARMTTHTLGDSSDGSEGSASGEPCRRGSLFVSSLSPS